MMIVRSILREKCVRVMKIESESESEALSIIPLTTPCCLGCIGLFLIFSYSNMLTNSKSVQPEPETMMHKLKLQGKLVENEVVRFPKFLFHYSHRIWLKAILDCIWTFLPLSFSFLLFIIFSLPFSTEKSPTTDSKRSENCDARWEWIIGKAEEGDWLCTKSSLHVPMSGNLRPCEWESLKTGWIYVTFFANIRCSRLFRGCFVCLFSSCLQTGIGVALLAHVISPFLGLVVKSVPLFSLHLLHREPRKDMDDLQVSIRSPIVYDTRQMHQISLSHRLETLSSKKKMENVDLSSLGFSGNIRNRNVFEKKRKKERKAHQPMRYGSGCLASLARKKNGSARGIQSSRISCKTLQGPL